jgi:pimeloyl-ACP methyl ester carboxylesterase
MLKAILAVVALAAVCAYVTLSLLYSHAQWQLVLHPSRTLDRTPQSLGLPFAQVHFADDVAGQPPLEGWWIPAAAPTAEAALILHAGDGTMADALSSAQTLHSARLNVLLFDYRGFGRSAGQHPDQSSMEADSESALAFLAGTQHTPLHSVVLVGLGSGSSLAVRLAAAHRDIPALILESPDGDFAPRALADSRSRMVPARWLFTQHFPLADPLSTLPTPKLLISFARAEAPAALRRAADPKSTIELSGPTDPALLPSIQRFLDLYLHRQPAQPNHIPVK